LTTLFSWNVNGIRAALRNGFAEWMAEAGPDVLCIQEVRAFPNQIEPELTIPPGYHAIWHPAKKGGYAGTATFTKIEPASVDVMGVAEFDDEGRVQVMDFGEFVLINAYFPNSQPERARIDFKVAFCDAMRKLCSRLVRKGRHVVLCGDYNIAHTEIDLARPKENEDSAGFRPEEREAMTKFLAAGFVDTFRHFNKEPGHYTWWSYRGGARRKNVGWRLDYHCVDQALMPRVVEARILADVMGSDHCPVALTIQ